MSLKCSQKFLKSLYYYDLISSFTSVCRKICRDWQTQASLVLRPLPQGMAFYEDAKGVTGKALRTASIPNFLPGPRTTD